MPRSRDSLRQVVGAKRLAFLAAMLCVGGCVPSTGGAGASPLAAIPPRAATVDELTPYHGSYAMQDGDTVVIARLGWFFDFRDAAYRTIYDGRSRGTFTIGRTFEVAQPTFADLVFNGSTLTLSEGHANRTGRHIDYRETDVMIPAAGAQLAGTITEPITSGPHPGIVVVHGAERGERHFYDVWVAIYASLGIDVLTYDKRGVGSSTGAFPGEFPSDAALTTYADDAAAARDFLSRWPGVDARHVGFHGGSQGGWTVPLAMLRHGGAAFAVLASAPATTVDQTDLWAGFSGGGAELPAEPTADMLAAVRETHTGYDPTPALQAMTAPALWLLGTNDRTVPTAVCIEILDGMHKPNFTVQQLPTGHGLLVNPTGLNEDDARSPGLAPELVPAIKTWFG